MKRLAVLALLSLLIFSSLALLPAPTARAGTISNDKIGTYTLFEHDFTKDAQVPDIALVYGGTGITLNVDNGLHYVIPTSSSGLLAILGLQPAVKFTIDIQMEVRADDPTNYSRQAYFRFKDHGTSEYSPILIGFTKAGTLDTEYAAKIRQVSNYKMSNTINAEQDGIYMKFGVRIYANMHNHTYGVQLFNATNATNTVYMQIDPDIYDYISGSVLTLYNIGTTTIEGKILYVKQYVDRCTITALPPKKLIGYGLDWAEEMYSTPWIVEEMKKYGYTGAFFLQPQNPVFASYEANYSVWSYFQNLTTWDSGVMLYNEPTSLTIAQAEENITNDRNTLISHNIAAPVIWEARQAEMNYTHVKYAWDTYGMINEHFGIPELLWMAEWSYHHSYYDAEAHKYVDGVDVALSTSASFFVFSDEVKNESDTSFNANESICRSTFITFLQHAHEKGYSIVGTYTAYKIIVNQYYATFTNIERSDDYMKFTAHTNGYKAWVDVSYTPTANTVVKDLTTGKLISWESGSVQFWVEDGHTYEIYEAPASAGTTETTWWDSLMQLFNTGFFVAGVAILVLGLILRYGVPRKYRHWLSLAFIAVGLIIVLYYLIMSFAIASMLATVLGGG